MDATLSGLTKLVEAVLGEQPTAVGSSFNLHFVTAQSFIKVTRPWVRRERFATEVATARVMHEQGVPVARSLTEEPLHFVDSNGYDRWVSFWERLTPTGSLTPSEATALSAEWILKLWQLEPPSEASHFQLDDFMEAVRVRMARTSSPLASRILAEAELITDELPTLPRVPTGLIHGDLHPDNLIVTTRGLVLVDWESSCVGPLEWDVAQNLRYTSPARRFQQEKFWARPAVNQDLVRFFRRVRSLSSLSHMVVADLTPPIYYRCLEDLGWT